MKTILSFFCGAAVMLGFSALRGSNPSHHVYELRMYHMNQGKTEALQARFRDHADAIFKRHNMKSIDIGCSKRKSQNKAVSKDCCA